MYPMTMSELGTLAFEAVHSKHLKLADRTSWTTRELNCQGIRDRNFNGGNKLDAGHLSREFSSETPPHANKYVSSWCCSATEPGRSNCPHKTSNLLSPCFIVTSNDDRNMRRGCAKFDLPITAFQV